MATIAPTISQQYHRDLVFKNRTLSEDGVRRKIVGRCGEKVVKFAWVLLSCIEGARGQ